MNTILNLFKRYSILRFAVIGTLGVPVDAGILWLMTHGFGLDPYSGRVISWTCAVTFTWTGNRYFTFGARRAKGLVNTAREWMRFVTANLVGGLVNVGLYSTLVAKAPPPVNNPYIALAVGTLAGLAFNFTLSNKLVFKGPL